MKKKYLVTSLLAVGIVIICLSVILTVIATSNKNIVGGADWHTFYFVFFNENNGLYSAFAFFGIAAILTATIIRRIKHKE